MNSRPAQPTTSPASSTLRTGERFRCDAGAGELWLLTSPQVADSAEKRRLASAYDAALVDMEAAAIARLAAMRGIPFYCIKGVSDGFNDQLPDFNRFLSPSGHFHLAAIRSFCPAQALVLARAHPDGRK